MSDKYIGNCYCYKERIGDGVCYLEIVESKQFRFTKTWVANAIRISETEVRFDIKSINPGLYAVSYLVPITREEYNSVCKMAKNLINEAKKFIKEM